MDNIEEFFKQNTIPKWNELPNLDLYLDQVVSFVNSALAPFSLNRMDADSDSSILSKTMINNYVKNNIIEAPIKKKYSRGQVAKIIVICILKQVYSINEIKTLIKFSTDNYELEQAYNSFCILLEEALSITFSRSKSTRNRDDDNDNRYLLKSVLLSYCYKLYTEYSLATLSK